MAHQRYQYTIQSDTITILTRIDPVSPNIMKRKISPTVLTPVEIRRDHAKRRRTRLVSRMPIKEKPGNARKLNSLLTASVHTERAIVPDLGESDADEIVAAIRSRVASPEVDEETAVMHDKAISSREEDINQAYAIS